MTQHVSSFPNFDIEGEEAVEASDFDVESMIQDDEDAPAIDLIGSTTVELPGGFGLSDGTIARKAIVKELNGYDEEKLTRADVKRPIDFITKVIVLGVESIGGQKLTPLILNNLLIGDRDMLIIGIRRATFGDELIFNDLRCPQCDKTFDVLATLDEIPIKKLEDSVGDRQFEVRLMHGAKAVVNLATHGDQAAMIDESSLLADQNTALLARCVISIGGQDIHVNVDEPVDVVRKLNMRDRALILKELRDRQPGPDFEGVTVTCPGCGFEDHLNLDPIGMFRLSF